MKVFISLLSFVWLIVPALAQFQFFEQMFNPGQEQHQPQNAGSDSGWYQQNYEAGMSDDVVLTWPTLIWYSSL